MTVASLDDFRMQKRAWAPMHLSKPYLLPVRVHTHTMSSTQLLDTKIVKQRLLSHFALLTFFIIFYSLDVVA